MVFLADVLLYRIIRWGGCFGCRYLFNSRIYGFSYRNEFVKKRGGVLRKYCFVIII